MSTVTLTFPPGEQTRRLRSAGLSAKDIKAAGFRWSRAQCWESEATPQAAAILARIAEGGAEEPPRTSKTEATRPSHPKPKPDTSTLEAAEKLAYRLSRDADNKDNPNRLTNTPRRLAQARSAERERDHLRRAASLVRRWIAEPAHMPDWRPNKKAALSATERKTEHVWGRCPYVVDSAEPTDSDDPLILELRKHYCDAPDAALPVGQIIQRKIDALPDLPGFFPTPEDLAARMVDLAGIGDGQVVLEPSAGKGDLADLMVAKGASVHVCEVAPALREILSLKGYAMDGGEDCLDLSGKTFDAVVMNPPFERRQDVAHLFHCWELLKPGGKLVALCSAMAPKERNFAQWAYEVGADVEHIENAFSSARAYRQTGVSCALVCATKETWRRDT